MGGGRRHRDIVRRKVEPDSCPGGGLGPGPAGMAKPAAGPGLCPFATAATAAVTAAAAAAAAQHCLWDGTLGGRWRQARWGSEAVPSPQKHPMHTQTALIVLKKAGAD